MEPPQRLHHVRLYDRTYLLGQAQTQGVFITSRTLTDWIVRGLVPPPAHHGLGQGKGSLSGWSQEQVGFWLTFLRFYQQDVPFFALYNVPVYGWLYGGEASGISLAQAQRAMQHWAKSQPHVIPQRKAWRQARFQISTLARPEAKGIPALARGLAVRYAGQDLDPEELVYLLKSVVAPHSQQSGPGLAAANRAAAGLFGVKTAREEGLEHLAEIPSALWEWARVQALLGEAEQQLGVEAMGKALARGYVSFRHPANKDIYLSCARLLTMLGLAYSFTHYQGSFDGYPPALRPLDWASGARTARLEARLEHSPLLLPNGRHPYFYYAITLAFQVR